MHLLALHYSELYLQHFLAFARGKQSAQLNSEGTVIEERNSGVSTLTVKGLVSY
jgi:hypothetical protein